MIIKFLYSGKIYCNDQIVVTKVCKNLTQLFGFPSIMKLSTDGNFLKKTQKQKLILTTDAFNLDDLLPSKKSNTDNQKVCNLVWSASTHSTKYSLASVSILTLVLAHTRLASTKRVTSGARFKLSEKRVL